MLFEFQPTIKEPLDFTPLYVLESLYRQLSAARPFFALVLTCQRKSPRLAH